MQINKLAVITTVKPIFTKKRFIQNDAIVPVDNTIILNIKLIIVPKMCAILKSIKLNNPAKILEKLAKLYTKSILS